MNITQDQISKLLLDLANKEKILVLKYISYIYRKQHPFALIIFYIYLMYTDFN